MDEYIKREELYEKAYWHGEHPTVDNLFPDGVDAIDIKDVDAIPAADVAPVRHGKWRYYHKQNIAVCTECSFERNLDANFGRAVSCPNCGARMDEEETHER